MSLEYIYRENYFLLSSTLISVLPCPFNLDKIITNTNKISNNVISKTTKNPLVNDISPSEKAALDSIKENVLDVYGGTGVQEVLNKTVFDLLKQICVFPAGAHKLADSKGNILPDCFLLSEGSTALDFAGVVHTDLAKNFIKAIDVRTKQPVGKDHKLKHRDGIEIMTR